MTTCTETPEPTASKVVTEMICCSAALETMAFLVIPMMTAFMVAKATTHWTVATAMMSILFKVTLLRTTE